MTREAARLQGRLAGGKRKRNENDGGVIPLTNGVPSKSRDDDDSEEEESRVKAISKKEKPKSMFDKFSAPSGNKKKQTQAGALANGVAAALKPTSPLHTPTEPGPSKARLPGATTDGVPILFPPASPKGTPVSHRTPSPARSTSISFGGSRTSRSISKAARRSLKQRAIFQLGRLEIVDIETPLGQTGTSSVTNDPHSPSPPKHQVNRGKGKDKETEMGTVVHVPSLIGLGTREAKYKSHTPPSHDYVISPTTPHPPRIRQSLPNGSSVLQLEPITPTTHPNQEPDSPKEKKHKRKRKKKKSQQAPGDTNEKPPVEAAIAGLSDKEE
jgi:hypothetical protein